MTEVLLTGLLTGLHGEVGVVLAVVRAFRGLWGEIGLELAVVSELLSSRVPSTFEKKEKGPCGVGPM
jgi:cytochrome b